MPKIAQYQPNQVQTQVVSQPLAPDAPRGAFDTPVMRGLTDIAKSSFEMKKRIDTTSAEEAVVLFEREKNDLFFNPDNGYFNSQGRDAYDRAQDAVKAINDLKKKHGSSLTPQARMMFDKVADQHITRSQLEIGRHSSQGLKAWETGTLESQVENTIENASLYWGDSDKLKVQNALGRQAIFDSAELQGLSYEETAEKVQTYDSAFAKSAIEAATQSSAANGKIMLEQYGDRLEGPDKIKIEKLIEQKTKIEKTKIDAQVATATATRLNEQYDNLDDMINEVEKIEDLELRKKALTEVRTRYNMKKAAEKEREADYYNEGIEFINNGGTAFEFQAANPEAWEGMSAKQRNNILAGKHMTTDQIKFNTLLSLPRKELADVNPTDYVDQFRKEDVAKLRTAVDKAKRGQSITSVQSPSQKITLVAEKFFGKKSTWKGNKVKSEKVQELMNTVQGDIEAAEEDKGGKLTPTEIDDVIANFSRRFVVERSTLGFDWLAPDLEIDLSNTPSKDIAELSQFVDQYGEDVIQKAVDKLNENDKPVNATTILNTLRQASQ
jgi:hypothetical protein